MTEQTFNPLDIAVVGMAGRFPDADNVDALWQNVRNGIIMKIEGSHS